MKSQMRYNIGKIHTKWVKIIPMTLYEFKSKDKILQIYYNTYKTPIGKLFIANTTKGICFVGFYTSKKETKAILENRFPYATIINKSHTIQLHYIDFFIKDWEYIKPLPLHIKGTPFQLTVWEQLLHIPVGKVTSYRDVAERIEKKRAYRAIGNAIGKNPILFMIPCHRVLNAKGGLGGFYWGINNKIKLLNAEFTGQNRKIEGYKNWIPTIF